MRPPLGGQRLPGVQEALAEAAEVLIVTILTQGNSSGWADQCLSTWQQGYDQQGVRVATGQAISGYGQFPFGKESLPLLHPLLPLLYPHCLDASPELLGFPHGYCYGAWPHTKSVCHSRVPSSTWLLRGFPAGLPTTCFSGCSRQEQTSNSSNGLYVILAT